MFHNKPVFWQSVSWVHWRAEEENITELCLWKRTHICAFPIDAAANTLLESRAVSEGTHWNFSAFSSAGNQIRDRRVVPKVWPPTDFRSGRPDTTAFFRCWGQWLATENRATNHLVLRADPWASFPSWYVHHEFQTTSHTCVHPRPVIGWLQEFLICEYYFFFSGFKCSSVLSTRSLLKRLSEWNPPIYGDW